AVEATDGLQRSSACRRPLGARLRPWHCGAVSGGGCTAELVGALGRHPLPDASAARPRFGPALLSHCSRDGEARPETHRYRFCGRRARADAAVARPDRPRGGIPARLISHPALSRTRGNEAPPVPVAEILLPPPRGCGHNRLPSLKIVWVPPHRPPMPLTVSLPPVDPRPANPPEIRPAKVFPWLDDLLTRDAVEAAGVIGDSLAAINRVEMSDSKRLELAERYWTTAATLWPQLERQFSKAPHTLPGGALASAKAALGLAHELSVAYKHLLLHESEKRIHLTGNRLLVALVHRCLQCMARVLINSYLSYSPVPPKTWLDAHAIYAFARERGIHQNAIAQDQPEMTPERVYLQALLLPLANPCGFLPGQLNTVVRYLQEFCHWAKLTDVAPVHRMAKAVAIIPVGHDFPPFSANKGGSIDGSKIFLLTFDLAFQIQEQLRSLEAGGEVPAGIAKDPPGRLQYVSLLKRLLRQWAIPPARQFNRLPSRARVVMCAGLSGVWQYSRGGPAGVRAGARQPPPPRRRRTGPDRPSADDSLPGDQSHARGLRAAPDRPQPDRVTHRRFDCAARRGPHRLASGHGALVPQYAEGERS